jgi:hypothetical protein
MKNTVEYTSSIDIKQFTEHYKKYGVKFKIDGHSQEYNALFTKQSTNFGGFKYFFKCNSCNSRVTKLYFPHLVCRKCSNLNYESSQTNTRNLINKIVVKYQALNRKWKKYGLKNACGIGGIPERPIGMNYKKYEQYQEEYYKITMLWAFFKFPKNYHRNQVL